MPRITVTGEALPAIKQAEVNIGARSACWNPRHARILPEKVSFWREKETGFHGKNCCGRHFEKPALSQWMWMTASTITAKAWMVIRLLNSKSDVDWIHRKSKLNLDWKAVCENCVCVLHALLNRARETCHLQCMCALLSQVIVKLFNLKLYSCGGH